MQFRERKIDTSLCEEGEERENKKSVMIKQHFGKTFVLIEDSKCEKFVFNEAEWTRFESLLKLLNKHVVRLFYDQEHFKSYINQVVTMGRYVPPSFYFPCFFRCETSRHDQQLTFDRLYDELVVEGRVGELENPVFDMNTSHSSL